MNELHHLILMQFFLSDFKKICIFFKKKHLTHFYSKLKKRINQVLNVKFNVSLILMNIGQQFFWRFWVEKPFLLCQVNK